MKKIETKIFLEATAELKDQVDKELEIEDPELEEAEAILKKKKKA